MWASLYRYPSSPSRATRTPSSVTCMCSAATASPSSPRPSAWPAAGSPRPTRSRSRSAPGKVLSTGPERRREAPAAWSLRLRDRRPGGPRAGLARVARARRALPQRREHAGVVGEELDAGRLQLSGHAGEVAVEYAADRPDRRPGRGDLEYRLDVARVAVTHGHRREHHQGGGAHELEILGVRLVAHRRERRLDGHGEPELRARLLVGVKRVEDAGGHVVSGVHQLAHQPRAGAAAAHQVHAAAALGAQPRREREVGAPGVTVQVGAHAVHGLDDLGPQHFVRRPEIVEAVYGVRAYLHRHAGRTYLTFSPRLRPERRGRVHLVCGGGTGAGLMRELVDAGYDVSAGVLN